MADWHKINQADWINVSYRIPDGQMRLEFLGIALHCLNEGGFPDNDEEIAFLVGLPVERIKEMRPYLNRLSEIADGILVIKVAAAAMAERAEFSRKQSQKAAARHGKTELATVSHGTPTALPRQATAERGNANTNIQTNKNTPLPPNGGSGGKLLPTDEARLEEPDGIDTALAAIFPGHSPVSRAMLAASECALRMRGTPVQIRGWPAWMTANFPKVGRTALNFVDYFPQMLEAKAGTEDWATEKARRLQALADEEAAERERQPVRATQR